ncbi:hypothetical protein [Actinoplanes utahensis]|uniref:Uncharacterized protein n=1 Tax=Actinoplanes utahensis TaxID=1869 RepID=A0A0A6USS8_ACTUT|nr:hypothetical protein [Actinoplanes utahensis]KHD77519.1 hypothetical protein MB27_10470 [Actinoplanes utahensis]GIF32680.1 hypothetical protein Aut01nite_56660 [Actinoplanes utahensis]
MRQALKDLTFTEHSEWFGLGPLALAVPAGVRAFLTDDSFARAVWIAISAVLLTLCAVYVIWSRRTRSAETTGPEAR